MKPRRRCPGTRPWIMTRVARDFDQGGSLCIVAISDREPQEAKGVINVELHSGW